MFIRSTLVALVRSPGGLGRLRSNVCVDEDIRNSEKENRRQIYVWGTLP